GDQVAQPPGPGEQRWVALRRRLNLLKLSRRILWVEARDTVAAGPEGAARQEQGREHALPHQRAAVCASGVASTRRCSASSSRPRNARKAAESGGCSTPPFSGSVRRAAIFAASRRYA